MKHILLVDDNIANLKLASNLLKDYYKVSLTKSGIQALEFCKKHKPDLILLDINMPNMNGFETINELKKNLETRNIPVIFLTASKDNEIEAKGFEYGAVDFITKPFAQRGMLHRIETHLQLFDYQEHLESVVKELEDSIITSFCELIECRDNETGGHIERTKEYVKLIALELQREGKFSNILNDTYIEMLVRSAPLHDIGKIGIRDMVLLKPGRLTNEEYEMMKNHTLIGEKVLTTIMNKTPSQHYLEIAKEVASSHHERFDGKGYPRQLRGKEIPLSGRIVAVADVYDALITDRVYRRAMSHEQACDLIIDGRGTQFDPVVVDAFMNVQQEIYKVAKSIN
ncbi:MAG: response regulator [Cellulosilyticum sp.]|nr:response regulator [Cellulosilyticum sp.]